MSVIKLVLIIIYIVMIQGGSSSNVGTTLLNYRSASAQCWSQVDYNKLRARMMFEELSPPAPLPHVVDDKYIKNLLNYFKEAVNFAKRQEKGHSFPIFSDAIMDMIGGHMRFEILPATRFAFYAGYIPFKTVESVEKFYSNVKSTLNTEGVGWKPPMKFPPLINMTVSKIIVAPNPFFNTCSCLITKRDNRQCIHLPNPKVDDMKNPYAIALPFKTGGLYSMTSPLSESILLKYYTLASKCIIRSSPTHCRHADFYAFNNNMWHWMKREVAPHLGDEKSYIAFAGVLRIAAAVQSYGKGLRRRNLFDTNMGSSEIKWRPWTFKDKYECTGCNWTPILYVGVVVAAAVAICLLQIFQNYIFKKSSDMCNCKRYMPKDKCDTVAYSETAGYMAVEAGFPAVLPPHPLSAVYIGRRRGRVAARAKTMSVASLKPRNQNIEKKMTVILSDEGECTEGRTLMSTIEPMVSESRTLTRASTSPPLLETTMSQLRPLKSQIPRFLTSASASRSEMTYARGVPDSRSWSESCTSSESSSSSHSVTRSFHSQWPRRCAPTTTKSTSQTETNRRTRQSPPKR